MRNVKTVSMCLPARVLDYVKSEADRLGLSVSAFVTLRLSENMYQTRKEQTASAYGIECREGE